MESKKRELLSSQERCRLPDWQTWWLKESGAGRESGTRVQRESAENERDEV